MLYKQNKFILIKMNTIFFNIAIEFNLYGHGIARGIIKAIELIAFFLAIEPIAFQWTHSLKVLKIS